VNKTAIEELQKVAQEESKIAQKKREIDSFRTEATYQQTIIAQKEIDALRNIDIDADKEARIGQILQENREYMEAARSCKKFMCKAFDGIVPNFGKNINLIGANTGEGKSTIVANIALETLMQGGKTLILTNEEAVPDVYNRITCLIKGWVYANHNEFSDEQKAALEDGIRGLSTRIDVVADSTFGPGTTTTIEGVRGVLESLIIKGKKYDSILIDYVQKISFSKVSPSLKNWEVLNNFMQFLDGFKNRYLAPITLLAQLHNSGNNNAERSFEDRLKGFKGIITPVTCAMEMVADKKTLTTKFVIHKNRWYSGNLDGQAITVGWYKGKYVDKDRSDFVAWAKQKQGERIARALGDKNAGNNAGNDD
jgi:hypothetical protein